MVGCFSGATRVIANLVAFAVCFATIGLTRNGYVAFAIIVISFTLANGIAEAIRQELVRRDQERRHELAEEIFAELRAGRRPRFALYLRPFEDPGACTYITNLDEYGPSSRTLTLEALVCRAVEPHMEIVALGTPSDREAAGQLATPDASWIAVFEQLAAAANLIVMLPLGEGTMHELGWLAEHGRLLDIVFVMPPADARDWNDVNAATLGSTDFKSKWEYWRERAAAIGINLPAHRGSGAVFRLERPGTPVELAEFLVAEEGGYFWISIEQAIKRSDGLRLTSVPRA